MNLTNKLELLYIPPSYWNEALSGFKLISEAKELPKDSSFFIAWVPTNPSEKDLIPYIKSTFPTVPANKLLTCKINLAIPLQSMISERKLDSNSNFFKITSFIAKVMPIAPTIKLLYEMEITDSSDHNKGQINNSIKTWAFLTKLLFELLNRGQFIPKLKHEKEDIFLGQWKILLKSQNDKERFKTILNNCGWSSFCIPANFIRSNGTYKSNGLWHPSFLFSRFLDNIGDLFIRSTLNKNDFQTFNEFYSREIKKEKDLDFKSSWDYRFLKSLIKDDPTFKIDGFHETILPSIIENWTQSAQGILLERNFIFNFELNYPKNSEEPWLLSLYLSSPEQDIKIPLSELWEGKNILKNKIIKDFENEGKFLEIILKALGIALKMFPPIKRGLIGAIQSEIPLSSKEVIEFLRYPKDLLIQSGFNVILPDVFRKGGKQRLSTKLIIRLKDFKKKETGGYSILPSIFNIKSMLETKWEATLGGKQLSNNEFNNLLTSNEPLISIDGKWILIEQHDLEELKQIKEPEINTYMEALKLGLTGKIQLEEGGIEYDLIIEGDLNDIIQNLQSIGQLEEIPCPSSFNGKLRSYQQKGLTWMGNMAKFNFGLCLADDMGLGKTIQVIAFLSYLKEQFPNTLGSYLIICPTSILFNWNREIKKFSPDLEVYFHHGINRIKDPKKISDFLKPHRVILTSYGTIRNDIDFLETIEFNGIIVDESQNMKNYASKQTQAIYKLKSQFRVCLSGTPIENRLLELWSLFNFLNPSLLGSRLEFQKKYILPIERFQDQAAIDKLKLIIKPFILRRVKSDKSIIKELPEKNEIKILIELTEEQVKLYKELVKNVLKEVQSSSIKKRDNALILSLLVKLKQICNHPYQYLKINIDSINLEENLKEVISQSKKLKRLIEMTQEVLSNEGKLLIFTQFTQMGKILLKVLEFKFKSRVLYFHGGIQEKKRKEIVDEFQSPKVESPQILIISLKAGGTGLNLTQGTTVIHFDRWWNPAVEDQATDRAYRIGQKSVVNVYKFISKGTVEEKIDLLLEEKKDLADKIVTTTGESWISELDGEKLKEILLLNE
jgi:SNF2 family DNA or RNA helicase